MKKKTASFYKKKAWAIFSKYIRLSHCKEGDYANCYTCGISKPWTELQAGHGIGGRNGAVLFLEEVVRPQCVGCNVFGRGKYAIFTRKLIDELGLKRYDELVSISNQILQYKTKDYIEVYEKYQRLFDAL